MATLSSHLFNSVNGTHAEGVKVIIYQINPNGDKKNFFETETSKDGRILKDFDLSKEDWLVSRAFSSPEGLIKKIKEKAPRDLVFLMMVSKNIKPSILGYDVDYIESSAANILKKNRGFLKISLSKN